MGSITKLAFYRTDPDSNFLLSLKCKLAYLTSGHQNISKVDGLMNRSKALVVLVKHVYTIALKGCWGIVFIHGVWMGRWAGGRKKFIWAVSQKR